MDAALIKQYAPGARPDLIQAILAGWPRILAAGINSPLRVAHFMAQIATETGGFEIFEENMNYSAERMCQVWPTRFHSIAEAAPFAHNPQALANNVYGGRMGNVNPGDGWKYHGRGFMQTTGHENYTRIGHAADPEKLLNPDVALDAALEEWTRGNLNPVADVDDLSRIRRVINGGLIGLDRAQKYLDRGKRLFSGEAIGGAIVLPTESPDAGAAAAMDPRRIVQAKLKGFGFYGGEIDGKIGPMTNSALLAYAISQFVKT